MEVDISLPIFNTDPNQWAIYTDSCFTVNGDIAYLPLELYTVECNHHSGDVMLLSGDIASYCSYYILFLM